MLYEVITQEILVRFNSTEVQLKAVDFIKADLGSQFVVALNLAPSTPQWLQSSYNFV